MILCPNRLPESERVCPGICKLFCLSKISSIYLKLVLNRIGGIDSCASLVHTHNYLQIYANLWCEHYEDVKINF